jgi:hypothetical protein
MKNRTKTPSYQKLPTLEGLASRRGQTVQQLLEQNNVKNVGELTQLLHRENMACENEPSSYFKSAKSPKSAVANKEVTKTSVTEDESASFVDAPSAKREGKKVRKDRHSYDAELDRPTKGADDLAVDETEGS